MPDRYIPNKVGPTLIVWTKCTILPGVVSPDTLLSRSRSLLQSLATNCSERAQRLRWRVRLVWVTVISDLLCSEIASYSLMTARTARVSSSEPFQSASKTKCRSGKPEWHAKPNERFRNNSVVKCEDTAASRSSRPRSPSGGWRLNTKYRGYSGKQANLTGILRYFYGACEELDVEH
eukprot:6179951-Pleurochrysis_carterae.AAC.1